MLSASVSENENGPWVTVVSKYGDEKMKLFADKFIYAVEPGIGVNETNQVFKCLNDADQQLEGLNRNGIGNYRHWERGALTAWEPYCEPWIWDYPHDEPINMESGLHPRMGVEYVWGTFYDDEYHQINETISAGMRLFTRLFDDNDMFADPAATNAWAYVGMKNRLYTRRRGGYFFASYGGKDLADGILGDNEYAMDLSRNSGTYDFILFENARIELTNNVENEDGMNLSGVATLCTLGWALTGTGPWAIAFGVSSAAFNLIDQADIDSVNARAESAVFIKFVHDEPAGYHTEYHGSPASVRHIEDGAKSPVDVTVGRDGVWVAGHAYSQFVDLESVSTAQTRSIYEIDVSSETIFKCIGANAQYDFDNMEIRIRCP